MSDCPNLTELKYDNNESHDLNFLKSLKNTDKLKKFFIQNNSNLVAKNLNILAPFANLKELDLSDCPKLKGSLKPLENTKQLEKISISHTNISEGLEYLPENCKELNCDLDYDYASVEIAKQLSKFSKETGKYDLDKWRIDQANNKTALAIPLERLFVIRGNLKQFINKWGKKYDSDWFEKIVNCYWKTPLNDLNKLQEPKEYSKYRYLGGVKWIARATAVTGGILALTDQPIIGGSLAAASPFVDAFATYIEENYYKARETKWNEFLNDADNFLDNYHELLGIIKGIKAGELGEVNRSFKVLKEKANAFLGEYDQPDETGEKNGEIDLEELIKKRKILVEDLVKGKKGSKVWKMVNSMKELENKVTNYRQGENIEEANQNQSKSSQQQIIINIEQSQPQILQPTNLPYGSPGSSK